MIVETERLQLVACTAPAARAVVISRQQAETLVDARLADDWPSSEIRAYLPLHAQQLDNDPSRLGWGVWFMIHRAQRVLIGDIGFKGKADSTGTVDIGYGVAASYRRQGYASEAGRALCAWALSQPGVCRVTADCLPENTASARVLQGIGMKRIGESPDGYLLWELLPSPAWEA